jgi:hypothetical protein
VSHLRTSTDHEAIVNRVVLEIDVGGKQGEVCFDFSDMLLFCALMDASIRPCGLPLPWLPSVGGDRD